MKMQRPLALLAAVLLVGLPLAAQVDTGSADFSRYVSMGDSLTAGFASGGLALDSQRTSYPTLIYTQVNGSSSGFEQPLVSDPGLPAQLQLVSLVPSLVIAPKSGTGQPANLTLPRPYDNMAVPGADVYDLLNTVTDNGGLHDLILRGLGTQLLQGLSLQPTFVSLWIGNNDALGAATSGIVIDGVTLTRAEDFEARFRTAVSTIAGTGAQLAMATIPDVTAIPFVTTIPPILVDPATSQPVIIGGSTVPLIGPQGALSPNDYVLLTAKAELAQGRGIPVALGGSGQPLSDYAVLSATEAATISNRIGAFNNVIRAVAGEVGAALVDVNAIFGDIHAHGYPLGGVDLTTDFLTGGLFSYDGVHANKLGYAIIANAFISAINDEFGGRIPYANLGAFAGGGAIPGIGAAVASSVRFPEGTQDRLLSALGYPSVAQLMRIKARRGGDPVDPGSHEPPTRPGHRPRQ